MEREKQGGVLSNDLCLYFQNGCDVKFEMMG